MRQHIPEGAIWLIIWRSVSLNNSHPTTITSDSSPPTHPTPFKMPIIHLHGKGEILPHWSQLAKLPLPLETQWWWKDRKSYPASPAYTKHIHSSTTKEQINNVWLKLEQESDPACSLGKYMGQCRDFSYNYCASRASLIYMLIGCTSKRQWRRTC